MHFSALSGMYAFPMCGIVGYVGNPERAASHGALEVIVEGLRRLEYRGYDSAGIAVVTEAGVDSRKKAGKLANLIDALEENPLPARSPASATPVGQPTAGRPMSMPTLTLLMQATLP